jgi:hypothetical protein
MTSTPDPAGPTLTRESLLGKWWVYLLACALVGGFGFSLLALWYGEGVAGHAMAGALVGPVIGVHWRWSNRRAELYRSKHNPPGPTLTLESLRRVDHVPAERRYGAPAATTIFLLSLLALCIPLVVLGALNQEPAWAWLVVWVVVSLPLGGLLWTVLYTYTEVGPDGIMLNKPIRPKMVLWSELAEVGWRREPFADIVVLSTLDGRKLKTVGIAVSRTGMGRTRALRMLADIERAWAASL